MTQQYTVAIAGCGPRGRSHGRAFLANPDRFRIVGLCDLDPERLAAASAELGVADTYADAAEMLAEQDPDVFCFCTLPQVRLPLVEAAVEQGVKAIAYEKPMATSVADARRIRDLCEEAGVKTVVSHQHKYGSHWVKVKQIIDSGEIGRVHTIHATAKGFLLQYATHLMDYVMFLNGGSRAERVVGHVHGAEKLADTHPSPDYAMGQIEFDNGVRAIIECGTLAPSLPGDNSFWLDAGATIHGEEGYAQVIVGSGWRAVTRSSGGLVEGAGGFDVDKDQPPYIADLAKWLDDPEQVHPCNGDVTYHGFETVMAICISALEHRAVELPLGEVEPVVERMKRVL